MTARECYIAEQLGQIDVLVGGPPCQGYSDLNNHTRRDDPRNGLYARMARAARVLEPRMVLVENVPTVRHDVEKILDVTIRALEDAGFNVADRVVDLSRLGVAQRRRRHVILALRDIPLHPSHVLDTLPTRCETHRARTTAWAINDLVGMDSSDPYDTPSKATATNKARIDWLFDHDAFDLNNSQRPTCHQTQHTYRSMYGRLKWDEPAQTVTTGFGSMGQGRYVHPSERRTITPHEAARLQGLPDFFRFDAARTRGAVARMIGNSVPPMLGMAIGERVLEAIVASADLSTAVG
jgi:DNA (cytosine-5)-methyltransferase 1